MMEREGIAKRAEKMELWNWVPGTIGVGVPAQ